jgi:secreted trypsin-like serine protease
MLIAGLAVLATAVPSPSAWAITNGQADEGRHPWVGALVSYDPETGDKYLICSGTLVAPTVFLTAAHCLLDEPSDLYVSFDSFVGAPDVGPEVKLYHGQAFGHPDFVDETAPGDTHDIAVVVLDQPVKRARIALLPAKKTLDHLARHGVTDDIRYGVVGYGREGHDEEGFFGGGSRRFGFSSFDFLEPFKLNLTQAVADGDGGTCRGDSGGPVFLAKTKIIVGIVSDGDPFCEETSVNYRVDSKPALKFLLGFLRRSGDDD